MSLKPTRTLYSGNKKELLCSENKEGKRGKKMEQKERKKTKRGGIQHLSSANVIVVTLSNVCILAKLCMRLRYLQNLVPRFIGVENTL